MEWGTFITVIIAVYLVWFGLNFLYDLFIGGKPKLETSDGIHYNMSDLMAEEEKPQAVSQNDFEHKSVEVHKTAAPAAPVSSDGDSSGQSFALPLAPKAPAPIAPEPLMSEDDWAGDLEEESEEKIDIPVQGQPMPVSAFIQSLKDQAKAETSAITF